MLELKLFILITVANGAPIIAREISKRIFGKPDSCPVDSGFKLADNNYLFGPSKTVRGIIASLIFTAVIGYLLNIPIPVSLSIALFAMLGDLLSSFIKRRLNKAPGALMPGLDQIPESLLPLLAVQSQYRLDSFTIAMIITGFIVIDLVISLILKKIQQHY
jgi:CDP-2,3-bis-(O-geranylgeranyl)-sn-glycerol synthase